MQENTKIEMQTQEGFRFTMDGNALDNARVFELLVDYGEGGRYERVKAVYRLLEMFMGQDQKEKYYRFLEKKHGKVRISLLEKEFAGIIDSLPQGKKKS